MTKLSKQSIAAKARYVKYRERNNTIVEIRKNISDIHEIVKAVWVGYYHSTSTDDSPNHEYCGDWCKQKTAMRNGMTISLHENNSTYISPDIAKYILPVYERLYSLDLLQRCQMGLTQNSNKSLHNVIWSRCPKGKFLGSHSVSAASSSAIIEFNFGKKWLLINMDRQAHITTSTIQIEYAESKEKKRLAGSLYEKKTKYRKTTGSDYITGEF